VTAFGVGRAAVVAVGVGKDFAVSVIVGSYRSDPSQGGSVVVWGAVHRRRGMMLVDIN
jgi:hypothetical protein